MFSPDTLLGAPGLKRLDKGGRELVLAFAEQLSKGGISPALGSASKGLSQFIQKAQPTLADVHVSTELTNLSIAYIQQLSAFAAGGTGQFGVALPSGFYTEYDKGDFFRATPDEALRAPNTESAGGGFKVQQTAAFLAKVYSWHKDVDEQLMATQTVGDPVDDATRWVLQILTLIREIKWDEIIMATSTWTGAGTGNDQTGVAAGPAADQFLQWDLATGTPRKDIGEQAVSIHEKSGLWPNWFICQPRVLFSLLINAEIVDAFKHTTAGATPTLDALARTLVVDAVPGVQTPRMAIAGGVKTTSAEGATDAYAYITGKKAILAHVAPNPSLYTPSAWINFVWTGLLGANAFGFRMKDLENEMTATPHRIEGDMAFDIKVVAPQLGVLFDQAVA